MANWIQGHNEAFGFKCLVCHDGVSNSLSLSSITSLLLLSPEPTTLPTGFLTLQHLLRDRRALYVPLFPSHSLYPILRSFPPILPKWIADCLILYAQTSLHVSLEVRLGKFQKIMRNGTLRITSRTGKLLSWSFVRL